MSTPLVPSIYLGKWVDTLYTKDQFNTRKSNNKKFNTRNFVISRDINYSTTAPMHNKSHALDACTLSMVHIGTNKTTSVSEVTENDLLDPNIFAKQLILAMTSQQQLCSNKKTGHPSSPYLISRTPRYIHFL